MKKQHLSIKINKKKIKTSDWQLEKQVICQTDRDIADILSEMSGESLYAIINAIVLFFKASSSASYAEERKQTLKMNRSEWNQYNLTF